MYSATESLAATAILLVFRVDADAVLDDDAEVTRTTAAIAALLAIMLRALLILSTS
jgi:hypothetical protein